MILKEGYSYNDLTIVPAAMSSISSRSECNPYIDKTGKLPLFTAPMSSVVNEKNYKLWKKYGITPILPRNFSIDIRIKYLLAGEWVALSLKEFEDYFVEDKILNEYDNSDKKSFNVCIDLANGHMQKLYDDIGKAKYKKNCYELTIMTGNIANPKTYSRMSAYNSCSKPDYIRLSIGSGNGCLTTSNTGVHYPIATLIDECNTIRRSVPQYYPKIVADGGIRNFSDIIKALALGADYVMVGSLFASFIESAAKMQYENTYGYIDPFDFEESILYSASDFAEEEKRHCIKEYKIKKMFYGMSTKKAQCEIGGNDKLKTKLKTSEGCEKLLDCNYTIRQWVDNFISYLKSAMSYTDSRTLDDFRRNVDLIINSSSEINSVNK